VLHRDDAMRIAADLRLIFTRELDHATVKTFAPHLVQVWSVPNLAVFSVRPLPRQVGLDGRVLVIQCEPDQRAFNELAEVGGALVVDVHCDFLRDERNQPVSSSLGPLLFGSREAIAPGGVMRLWLRVAR
jgi:hypothetical protein